MKRIIAYKRYFADFLEKLSEQERQKVIRTLSLLKEDQKVPRHYIKFIRDGIYEFRITYINNEFRIFFIYDGPTIVVLFSGFKKKTQKTPQRELDKVLKLKREYDESKRNL